MPHVALTQEELDRLHPSLVPPCDEQLDDLVSDERDGVYQKGLRLAEEIRSETSLQGRMRRPLLAVTEQQQHDDSSSQSRTRTIRPFGGGVISGATTYVLLPTEYVLPLPGTTTAVGPERLVPYGNSPGPPHYVLPLPGTTTTTTTTTTGAVAAVRVDGVVGEVAREEPRRTEPDRTDTGLRVASFCGSNQPSVNSIHATVLAP